MRKFKILMISPEATPIAKSGGLGDMVAALSKELAAQGHDVRLVLPRYGQISLQNLNKHPAPLGVPLGFSEEWAAVYEGLLPGSNVPVYYIDHEQLFGNRHGIYGDWPDSAYLDNAKRFTFYCRAAFQLCKMLNWQPNIMHAHDWAAGLVPLYLYTWEKHGFFKDTASIFTIHNLAYQGYFHKENLVHTQLSWHDYFTSGLERFDSLNFMQSAIYYADLITTVSPTYANEIQTTAYGEGLEGILSRRSSDLFGVINGIDYNEWDSKTDPAIKPYNYDINSLDKKLAFKQHFQKQIGLEVNPSKPLIAMIARFVPQKGIEELLLPGSGSLYNMVTQLNSQFVILGTGEYWAQRELEHLASFLPNLKVFIAFNSQLAHQIEAAADFFLMPSRYEPCGLNQMYSQHYGTLPIVRRTGGLNDTVDNHDGKEGGTGFMLDYLSPKALYDTVNWAVWTYYNKPKAIMAMQKRAMNNDFSWEKSANRYGELYQWAVDRKLGHHPRSWIN